jgi:hypothetical protein
MGKGRPEAFSDGVFAIIITGLSKSAFNPVTFSPVLSSPSETTNLATGGSDQTRCWCKRRYTSTEYGPAATERAAHVMTARRLLCGRPERR